MLTMVNGRLVISDSASELLKTCPPPSPRAPLIVMNLSDVCGIIARLRGKANSGLLRHMQPRSKILRATIQGHKLRIVISGNLHLQFFVQPNDEIQRVHAIDVQSVTNSQVPLELVRLRRMRSRRRCRRRTRKLQSSCRRIPGRAERQRGPYPLVHQLGRPALPCIRREKP